MCLVCVLLCVACVSVWSWSALQSAWQDLKIALANTPSVHPLFGLYCIVYYKGVCVCRRHYYQKVMAGMLYPREKVHGQALNLPLS